LDDIKLKTHLNPLLIEQKIPSQCGFTGKKASGFVRFFEIQHKGIGLFVRVLL
jgi:hypothetical protein